MRKTSSYLKSFSFRAGVLIFLGLCATLVTLRILIYYESINETYEQVRLLIDAHADEMNQDMENIGSRFVQDTIDAILEDAQDKNLYIGLKTQTETAGNFNNWNDLKPSQIGKQKKTYHEFFSTKDGAPHLHILAETITYPKDTLLVVGYNLNEVDTIRHNFFKILIENIALAFLISLIISFIIIWLLNRHFKKLNDACTRVISGDIDFRIKVNSDSDQFDQLAQNINRMLDWNNALISTVKDSTNAIAHDMRTPLSRLRLKLRALSDKAKLDTQTRLELDQSVYTLDKLVEMFDNLLKIARAESRSSTDLFEDINLQMITADIIEFYDAILEEKNLTITTKFPDTPPILRGDKQLMNQTIVNLLDNACKYTPPNGKIDITIEKNDQDIRLTIADNGEGIDENLLERAQERFFRADESRHEEGYGLGLSLVQAVATLHHGQLQLSNNHPGLKASLIFSLQK